MSSVTQHYLNKECQLLIFSVLMRFEGKLGTKCNLMETHFNLPEIPFTTTSENLFSIIGKYYYTTIRIIY